MAQAAPSYNNFTIRKEFQVSLFWKFIGGDPMRTGEITGEFEITVDMDTDGGDWQVTDLWINADNGKLGTEARGQLINLSGDEDADDQMALLILDALDHQYATRIECWVQDELCERRYVPRARDAA